MKVLMFGWEFPPHITGGLGTACHGLSRGLSNNDVGITFVVPRAYGDEDSNFADVVNASDVEARYTTADPDETIPGLCHVRIDSSMVPYVTPGEFRMHCAQARDRRYVSQDVWYQRYSFSGRYGPDLMEEVARYAVVAAELAARLDGRFDVIHAHDWLTYYAGIAARRVSGKPLVLHIHATEFDRSGENVNQSVYDIERAGMQAADRVIAVSYMTRRTVIERYGIDPSKVVTIHNAVAFGPGDERREGKTVADRVVTFLGRITYQKGPEYFVEAAAKVLKKVPDVRFVMAGSGDMMDRIVRRVAQLGIGDRFHFTGFLQGDDVHRMFSMSDVYVMPSVSEPFGISPLEAMRSNVPVIISKQSGVAEILKHAVKVDYWDVDAMANAIYALLRYPVLGEVLAREGHGEIMELKWDDAARKIKDVYSSVCGG